MKKLLIKFTTFIFPVLITVQVNANQSSNQLELIRQAVKHEHKNVVQDYKCIEKYLQEKGDNKALDTLANSRATYDRLYKIVFTDISMEELKKITQKNMEDFMKIETAGLVFQDSSLATCVYFGFHFQDLNIRAGNEPL